MLWITKKAQSAYGELETLFKEISLNIVIKFWGMRTGNEYLANLCVYCETATQNYLGRIGMEQKILKHVDTLIERYPILSVCRADLIKAYEVIERCYERDGKLLIAGNGGSAADSEHIAGELMKRFKIPRPVPTEFAEKLKSIDAKRGEDLAKNLERGLMAIPLVAHEALTTAYINDVDSLSMFAQQLYGFGREGDVFLGISTSGNSRNVMSAIVVARALGIKVIGLTGKSGGELGRVADVTIRVPENETYKIQELHLPVYHCLCLMLEDRFFGAEGH